MRTGFVISHLTRCDRGCELVDGLGGVRLFPRIVGRVRRPFHRGIKFSRDPIAVIDNDRANSFDAKALQERVGAFLVFGVLSVILHEAAGKEQYVVFAVDHAEKIALPDVSAAGAADIDFPLSVANRDHTNILDQRFRAIARTTGCRQLELAGTINAAKTTLDLERQLHAVAETKSAEISADAGLAGAITLAPRVTCGHAEIIPDTRQIILLNAHEVDALTAGDFDERHIVFYGRVGYALQLSGRTYAAWHFWND